VCICLKKKSLLHGKMVGQSNASFSVILVVHKIIECTSPHSMKGQTVSLILIMELCGVFSLLVVLKARQGCNHTIA